MSIFDLEHIFIVFHPGAGGNFIASLLENIVNDNHNPIKIGSAGTAHSANTRKIDGVDYLSFGTEIHEQAEFENQQSRINFYIDKNVISLSIRSTKLYEHVLNHTRYNNRNIKDKVFKYFKIGKWLETT